MSSCVSSTSSLSPLTSMPLTFMFSTSSLSPTVIVGNVMVNGCNSAVVSMGMSIHTDVQTVVLVESWGFGILESHVNKLWLDLCSAPQSSASDSIFRRIVDDCVSNANLSSLNCLSSSSVPSSFSSSSSSGVSKLIANLNRWENLDVAADSSLSKHLIPCAGCDWVLNFLIRADTLSVSDLVSQTKWNSIELSVLDALSSNSSSTS